MLVWSQVLMVIKSRELKMYCILTEMCFWNIYDLFLESYFFYRDKCVYNY